MAAEVVFESVKGSQNIENMVMAFAKLLAVLELPFMASCSAPYDRTFKR